MAEFKEGVAAIVKILHGTWIPEDESQFIRTGGFYLWVETTQKKKAKDTTSQIHPHHLQQADLELFLNNVLGIKPSAEAISPKSFLLPTANSQPLPSLELARYLETEPPEEFDFEYWQIDCYQAGTSVKLSSYTYATVDNTIHLLNDLHFLALYSSEEFQLGSDLLFWYYYTQALKQVIFKDQYIPALKYREVSQKTKGRKKSNSWEIYPGWEIVSEQYETDLKEYAEAMPLVCVAGFATPQKSPQFYDPETLLHHFSEGLLTEIVTHTPSTAKFERQMAGTILEKCFDRDRIELPGTNDLAIEEYQQWQVWRHKITHTQTAIPFYLYFQLQAPNKVEEPWQLHFLIAPKSDPSLRLLLLDYWRATQQHKTTLQKSLGKDFESNLLLNLGYAARIYPKLWQGLETDQPAAVLLDLDAAFEFLKETAWVLEDAGYKVIVPAWWTPTGRKRAKLRLKVSKSKSASKSEMKGYFSLDRLVQYQYQLAIGDEPVTPEEWQQLVQAKTPLVQFRGQWVELDPAKMQQMLEFWQKHGEEHPEMSEAER
jgi:SNF2 Helicase protein